MIENAKPIDKLDVDLFFRIVEKSTVIDYKMIVASLVDGTEIEVEIE